MPKFTLFKSFTLRFLMRKLCMVECRLSRKFQSKLIKYPNVVLIQYVKNFEIIICNIIGEILSCIHRSKCKNIDTRTRFLRLIGLLMLMQHTMILFHSLVFADNNVPYCSWQCVCGTRA
jgi:hypothetical protein